MLTHMSLAQRNVLEDLMSRCQLYVEQRATLADDINGCNFTPSDALALVSMAVGKPKATSSGEKLGQDYVEFAPYMPEDLQDRILAGIHPNELQEEIFVFLGKGGMRR